MRRCPAPPMVRTLLGAVTLALALCAAPAAMSLDGVSHVMPGADDALQSRLRAASLLREAEREGVEDPQELLAAAKAEYGRMVSTLYAAGHYGGVVSVRIDGREAADFAPLEVPRRIGEIVVTVEIGPEFRFGRAEVAPVAEGTELPGGFAPGSVARSDLIREAAQAAVSGWRSAGHARAEPGGSRIIADHRRAELDAQLEILPGPLARFGALRVTGIERMREERVRTIAGLPEGAQFDPEAVAQAAQRLRRTGSFASVALTEAEALGPGNSLDITATLVEAPLRRFGFGAELDSEDGVQLTAFWLHRNLLGGAERLRIEGEIGGLGSRIGGREYRFVTRYARPATFTPDTTLNIGITAETVTERDYDARQFGVEAGLSHIFSDRLTGEAGVGYFYERTRDAGGTSSRAALLLPVSLRYDARDDDKNATRGYFLEGAVTPFVGLQGGGSGGRITLDARGYVPASDRVVLAGRAQIGSVIGAALDAAPRQFLFLSGGGATVRGQPFRSLGVERVIGGQTVRTGGRGFAAISGEARVGVTETIGVVAFADAGIVSASSFLSGGEWHAGAGLGLRYATGIGPIRVDVAAPIRGRTGRGAQLYVGIGQAF